MVLCEIRVGEHPAELVRVRDLSECGIKIATNRTLLLGDRLRVRLPGATDWCLARVAWAANGTAGLAFSRAVDLPGVVGARPGHDVRLRPEPWQRERVAS
jgi:hypothetical protein